MAPWLAAGEPLVEIGRARQRRRGGAEEPTITPNIQDRSSSSRSKEVVEAKAA
jgi:hypothetical protein